MRKALPFAAVLALAACDSGGDPSEGARKTGPDADSIVEDAVRLEGEGLAVGGEAFRFNAGRNEVETALAKALGEPVRRATNTDCEAGAVDFTDYEGGLTLHFTEGQLVGWNWHLPYEGDAPIAEEVAVAGDVALGIAAGAMRDMEGFEMLADSTLGREFRLGAIGGFIEADEVATLFAGTQCFIRGEEAAR
ncbi:MAG: aspartate-semialdehyde dehydrogenase [Erythrobacter sp.]|uniref:aspartate-semialdehyde dehydrogenase n=1 Tax=Erythrobacter sp. TaxID=1042 RepID=UPI0032ED9050